MEDLRRNWNEEFQSLYLHPIFSSQELQHVLLLRRDLMSNFLRFSRALATQLVLQRSQAQEDWPIKPASQRLGIAGGEKFLVGTVLCKFARDVLLGDDPNEKKNYIYYKSDDKAIRMAKNEIRHANAVLAHQSSRSALHLPWIACHRIRGHAVIVSALVPIQGSRTLVYGSNDAGRTVRKSDEAMNRLIDELASCFGLDPHHVRGVASEDFRLSVAVDIEGHVSEVDGRK